MYQTAYYDKKTNIVHIWDDTEGHLKIEYEPYAYQKHLNGNYTSLYGDKLKKVTNFKPDDSNLFESDVSPVTRTLIDKYYKTDDVSTNHRILYFDIETSTKGGASNPKDANQPITAIAYYYNGDYTCLILNEVKNKVTEKINGNTIIWFNNEKQLLEHFISDWIKIKPTIVTHWNGDYYDMPYFVNRAFKIVAKRIVNRLSPLEIIELKNYNSEVRIIGVESFDLMELYKKFVQNEAPNYTLDFISKLELNRGKIEYQGSLEDLYTSDINKFITYNIEDVVLLVELEKKLNYIELAKNLCHKGHVTYNYIYMNSVLIDGASLTYMKRNEIIAPNKKKPHILKLAFKHNPHVDTIKMDSIINNLKIPSNGVLRFQKTKSSSISIPYSHFIDDTFYLEEKLTEPLFPTFGVKVELPGAYVKKPVPGLYDLIYDLDLASLYPSIIMQLNISPETKRGRIMAWDEEGYVKNIEKEYTLDLLGSQIKLNTKELKEWIKEHNYSIASNGVMYDQSVKGFVPTILNVWFKERSQFKNLRDEYKKEGDLVNTALFNQKQTTTKVLLNSFYGVLALNTFRFFDIDNAEAVTSTGQSIIKFSAKSVEHYYKRYGKKEGYEVDYCDTDSQKFDTFVRFLDQNIQITDLFDLYWNDEKEFGFIDPTNRLFVIPSNLNLPFYDENNKLVKYGKVEYIEKHKVKKQCFKINLKNGKFIEVTKDHSIMVLRNNTLIKVTPLEILKTDKFICIK